MTWPAEHLAAVAELVTAVGAAVSADTSSTVSTFEAPPETAARPAVYAAPANPWASRRHAGACVETLWELRLTVPRFDATAGLEQLLSAYATALGELDRLLGVAAVGPLDAPYVEDVAGAGPALTASLAFTVTSL